MPATLVGDFTHIEADGKLKAYYWTGDINVAGTPKLPITSKTRLLTVTLTYKTVTASGGATSYAAASVTKTCTVTLDAAAGSAYDALLNTISLSAASAGQWAPQEVQAFLPGDQLAFAPQAGGANISATLEVKVVTDEVL